LDARSRLQTEVWVTYSGFIVAWFCFLFMIQLMNPRQRNVSPLVFVAFTAAVYAIAVGFVMRKKFLLSQLKRFMMTLKSLSTARGRPTSSVGPVRWNDHRTTARWDNPSNRRDALRQDYEVRTILD
jgi:hypothetical protein